MDDRRTLLLTLTGLDRPGVTSALFTALGRYAVEVLDIEQVVIRGRLVLGVLVTAPRDEAGLRTTVEAAAADLGMHVDVAPGRGGDAPRGDLTERSHVSVLGAPLRPPAFAALAGRIADVGGNIDRIVRVASYPVTAVELEVCGVPTPALRAAVAREAAAQGLDVAVQPAGLRRRAKRLVVMDVDTTRVQGEDIEWLADHLGRRAEVAGLTEQAMRGDVDFATSLRARVGLLAGLEATALDDVRAALVLTPGARTLIRTLKRLDHRVGVVSGGFAQVVDGLVAELALDFSASNTLEIADGRLTGRLVGEVIDRPGKARALERFAREAGVALSQTVAIGDGANDLDMLAVAGLGIAFNAKPAVRQAADAAVNVPYLDAILYLLGISREEVEAADLDEGYVTPAPALP